MTVSKTWYPVLSSSDFSEWVGNYLPHEHMISSRLEKWRIAVHRASPSGPVDGDIAVLLRPVQGHSGLRRALQGRELYQSFPIPGRPAEAGLIAFEDSVFKAEPGRPYLLKKTRKALVHLGLSPQPEVVIMVGEHEDASPSTFYPPGNLSQGKFTSMLKELSKELCTDRNVVEPLLTPFAGAPQWGLRSAGIESSLGCVEVDSWGIAQYVTPLKGMLPFWQHTTLLSGGLKVWGGNPSKYPVFSPYHVDIARIDTRGVRPGVGEGDLSALRYGPLNNTFLSPMLDSDLPILRGKEDLDGLPGSDLSPEFTVEVMDYLLAAHLSATLTPVEETLATALREANASIRQAKEALYRAGGHPSSVYMPILDNEVSPTNALIRSASSLARLKGLKQVRHDEVHEAEDITVESIRLLADSGRSADIRQAMRFTEAPVSKLDEKRRMAVKAVTIDPASLDEVWEKIHAHGLFKAIENLATYLDGLQVQGMLLRTRSGGYKWIG